MALSSILFCVLYMKPSNLTPRNHLLKTAAILHDNQPIFVCAKSFVYVLENSHSVIPSHCLCECKVGRLHPRSHPYFHELLEEFEEAVMTPFELR
jgi:hypothetical protein